MSRLTKEDRQEVYEAVAEYILVARERFDEPTLFRPDVISFKLSGVTAGYFQYKRKIGRILKFSPHYLLADKQDMLEQTVPHEVAHLVVFDLYESDTIGNRGNGWSRKKRNVKAHGHEWQQVMRVFGKNPNVTHTYDTSHLITKNRISILVGACNIECHPLCIIG